MVKEYGSPAGYPKKMARDIFSWVTVVTLIGLVGASWFSAYCFYAKSSLWTIGIALLGLVFGWLVCMRWYDRYLVKMGKERIRYWRGGQTEALVAMLLRDLEGDWHVFHGVMLQEGWDIDHIAVGPGGVFSISTKSSRGCYSIGEEGKVHLNGKLCKDVPDAMSQAMELRGRLEALMGADVPFVQPVLAAPFGYVDYAEKSQRVWVLQQENLADVLNDEGKKKRLTTKQIARAAETLEMLAKKSKDIWQREKAKAKAEKATVS